MPRSSLPLVRLLALVGLVWFKIQIVANVAQTWAAFDPTYWTYYVQQQLTRPLIGIGFCLLVWLFARPLARRIDRE
ncbi:MAG: hypothetical protein ABII82_02225 [Verrucomicrobiota bacterium]